MEREPVRWRWLVIPAGIVLFLAAVALTRVWSTESPQRQDQVVPTILIATGTLGGVGFWSAIWLLFVSRLSKRAKVLSLVGALLLLLLVVVALEPRGFSGDVIPVFGWRWSEAELPAPQESSPRGATSSEFDWPQFQGPRRDGTAPGVRLAREWPETPRELWRVAVGAAWSGFAIAGDYAVTQEQRGEEEVVSCYDLGSGTLHWLHADTTRWEDGIGGPGPRATPSIHDGRVYTLGGTGRLNALDLATGAPIWSRDVLDDTGARLPQYGVSASPLVFDGLVIVAAGGTRGQSLVAYDAATGERRWAGGTGPPAYGSPRHAVLAGVAQILILNGEAVVGHDAESGRVLWEVPWPGSSEHTFQPVVLPDDRVFVSTGYGVGGKLFRVRCESPERCSAELLWESRGLKAKFTNVVFREGFLYGLDDGILVCLDPENGERRWKRGRHGHGQVMLVDDLLIVMGEDGSVSMVEANPERYRELSRFQGLAGKTWNHPALAGPYLVVRNDREAACFELPLASSEDS
jgi:outer membrane protein assembly factor BamB